MQANSSPFDLQVVLPFPTVSPNGTKMPPSVEIIDAESARWTLGGQTGAQFAVLRNGVQVAFSVDFVTIKDGVVYQSDFGSGSGWSRWGGSAWVASGPP